MTSTTYTHDIPGSELSALLERLQTCNGVQHDAALITWEHCQLLARALAEAATLKAATATFLASSGHDLCHQNRQELARAAGMADPLGDGDSRLPSEMEFARRCIEYRQSLYGHEGPGSDQEVYEMEIARLEADLHALKSVSLEMRAEPLRSSRWPQVRSEHLLREPFCQGCGTSEQLAVHHILPVQFAPERELDPENLITLCEKPSRNCHFVFGHGYSWNTYFPAVRTQLTVWRSWLVGRKACS